MENRVKRRSTKGVAGPIHAPKRTRQELEGEITALRQAIMLQQDKAEITESDLIASSMDAILLIDESHNIVQFNAAAEEVFGYPADRVIGKPLQMLLPEPFRERHLQHMQNFARTGLSSRNTRALGTVSGRRENGESFPLEISFGRITRANRVLYFAIARDMSARTKLEELLVRQYDSLDSLHQITLGLLGQCELGELLQIIVDEAAKLLDSTHCEMLIPEGDELVAKAYTQDSPFPSGNRFKRQHAPLSWKVFDSGMPQATRCCARLPDNVSISSAPPIP